ncbi:MAG: tetratricopeptide repeat protein [Planctomycetes bacterium]|nr:tetratricopeptide repeat protein [Planctomycetota bacterium]
MPDTRIRIVAITTGLLLLPASALGQARVGFPRTWSPGYRTASPGPLTTGLVSSPMRTVAPRGVHVGTGSIGSHHFSGSRTAFDLHSSSDGLSLSVHVGSDPGLLLHTGDRHLIDHHVGRADHFRSVLGFPHFSLFPFYYPYYGWLGSSYGYGLYNSYYGAIDGSYYQTVPSTFAYSAPQAQPPQPTMPLADDEQAAQKLGAGHASDAIDLYRAFLRDNPDDAPAMRGLALALLADSRFKEGVAMMAMAYRTDPPLADEAIDTQLFESEKDLRGQVRRCVIHANRTGLASAWLTVAVLMQAEDRDERALKMLQRARDAGLDTVVADNLVRALGG